MSKLTRLWKKLDRKDRVAARKFARKAFGKLLRGDYDSADEVLAEATKTLKPRAIDWDSLLAFINGLMPLIEAMIAMSPAGG